MKLDLLWTVLGMLAVTYSVRVSFLGFGQRVRFPAWLQRSLHYVPAAVLTALVAPMTLAPQGTLDVSLSNAYLPGVLATGLAAWWTRHTLGAIVCGFVVYAGWRWLS